MTERLQGDVEEWVQQYNEARPHSGKRCYGKTLMDSLDVAKERQIGSDWPDAAA